MALSTSSSSDITSYSQEERIVTSLKQIRKRQELLRQSFNQEREKLFSEQATNQDLLVVNLPGLKMIKFTHKKIKFSFQPSLVYEHINQKYLFYCSLEYLDRYKKWIIKREPMPCKPTCYAVTHGNIFIEDKLDQLFEVIAKIYVWLKLWSEKEIKFRKQKYSRYKTGEVDYVEIDSVDELYFSDAERQAIFEKKQKVLQRMIPPVNATSKATRRGPRKKKTKM
ncbi:uncharacterized protein [Euwallacea similis]|uniref:uncharacterized protein n=1 Tax=Euwallacea similis TaxID=1736056 RepID=UPI003450DB6E